MTSTCEIRPTILKCINQHRYTNASRWPITLRAPTRAPTTPAAIARTVARHDAAAEAARGSVAQVDDAGQSVGSVHRTLPRPLVIGRRPGTIHVAIWQLAAGNWRLHSQILEQKLLLPGQETQLQPAEDVVHDRLGKADVGIAGPAARLKPRVRELFAQQLQRHPMLQRNGRSQRKAIHQP